MEHRTGGDRSLLISELIQVQELVRQLEAHLDQPSPIEFCKSLARKILPSVEKSISLARMSDSEGQKQLAGTESPRSATESPRSENSNQAFKDSDRKEMSKKRKTLPKRTSQVAVSPGAGVEGPLDDGYSWRKYGQKEILGAKYPRGYYRCTHRNTQGCTATKQVQRSDENPLVFDVTYHGAHTCLQRFPSVPNSVSPYQELKQSKPNFQEHAQQQQQQQQQDHNLLLTFQRDLKVKTQGSDSDTHEYQSSLSFSFPSTPVSGIKAENHVFSSASTLDNGFMGSFSPSFLSPTTSESNYFSVSPGCMSNYGGGLNLQKTESNLTEIIPAATSATNSPLMDMDFLLEPLEFDPKFQLDASSFYS
ncbi:probable WRKY transcription factor 53 [Phoenix dactylifera]|uniref:Probable WRKY transcription factor 53 n=1 Tax=Phoenix dactylifera TaxID=42345 RepID=A0A8B7C4A7_PHODC|nr:probable WRKY transcription factor 53 [Phoenix dactylifera]